MTALIIATALLTFFAMRFYANDEGRLPSPSTKKGKEARIVVGTSSVILLLSLVANATITEGGLISPSLMAIFAGGLVAICAYVIRNKEG